MFKIINIFEIILDYLRDMKKDLKAIPFLVDLLLIPLAIAVILYFSINDFKKFAQTMITITSIFVPLLLNVLIIVHYSVERTKNTKNTNFMTLKLEFLKHVNSTTSMVILISTLILFLSIVLTNMDYNKYILNKYILEIESIIKLGLMFLVGFMFVNVIITLLRVYRLINFEIKEYRDGNYGH